MKVSQRFCCFFLGCIIEENDKLSLLALEEIGPLEVSYVSSSLDKVELNRGDSLEVRFSFEGLKAH